MEQTIVTVGTDLSVDTTPGIPTVTQTGSAGIGDSNASSSDEGKEIGVQAGVLIKGGIAVGASKEGIDALKDAGKELKNSLTTPAPPPTPTPPPPPPCGSDNTKKCQ